MFTPPFQEPFALATITLTKTPLSEVLPGLYKVQLYGIASSVAGHVVSQFRTYKASGPTGSSSLALSSLMVYDNVK
jgi:hypothetical protein